MNSLLLNWLFFAFGYCSSYFNEDDDCSSGTNLVFDGLYHYRTILECIPNPVFLLTMDEAKNERKTIKKINEGDFSVTFGLKVTKEDLRKIESKPERVLEFLEKFREKTKPDVRLVLVPEHTSEDVMGQIYQFSLNPIKATDPNILFVESFRQSDKGLRTLIGDLLRPSTAIESPKKVHSMSRQSVSSFSRPQVNRYSQFGSLASEFEDLELNNERPRLSAVISTVPECCVCQELLNVPNKRLWKCERCKNDVHHTCITSWQRTCRTGNKPSTCPSCRAPFSL